MWGCSPVSTPSGDLDFIAGWRKDTGEHFLLCLEQFLRPEARVLKPGEGVMADYGRPA